MVLDKMRARIETPIATSNALAATALVISIVALVIACAVAMNTGGVGNGN